MTRRGPALPHACEAMVRALGLPHAPLRYVPFFREHAMTARRARAGHATRIAVCPWCGGVLPRSLRDLWFARHPDAEPPRTRRRGDSWWRKLEAAGRLPERAATRRQLWRRRRRGVHCCLSMDHAVHDKESPLEYEPGVRMYSFVDPAWRPVAIRFCPWCGKRLRVAKRLAELRST